MKKLTNDYLSVFFLEISMLLRAGITVTHGVEMMWDDEANEDGRIVLQSLLDGFRKASESSRAFHAPSGGVPLSEAMRVSGFFPSYAVGMIEIGEKTGRLPETLKALAGHYERQERLAISVKNAVMYPGIMLVMMISVVIILIVRVLPVFNEVFERLGAQMSPFAAWLTVLFVWVAAVVIGALFFAALLASVPPARRGIVRVLVNKFGGRGIFGRVAASGFVSSMALALASGINIEESMELAASLNTSEANVKKYEKCAALLREGNTLAGSLKGAKILSARDSRILSLGDKSGTADSAMAEIARRRDTAVQDEISNITGRIEPTLVIITSVIVGIILLSAMLPLVGIMSAIG